MAPSGRTPGLPLGRLHEKPSLQAALGGRLGRGGGGGGGGGGGARL